MLKICDKVKYVGASGGCFHNNGNYTIINITEGTIVLIGDNGKGHSWNYPEFFKNFSLPYSLQESQSEDIPDLPNDSVLNFKELTKKMAETYERKNHDYGNSFEVSMNEEGLAAARIRLGDKWLRFKQLSKGKEALVKDESIRDTLLDMANYCIMTVMWMDNQNKVFQV